MKRLNRQEMTGIIGTLQKANHLASLDGTTFEQKLSILKKCQDSAITLGEALERYGTVGEQVIHMLEEYCEALYQQSCVLENAAMQKEFHDGIAALLRMIEEKIAKELPEDKKVVVFLPYKASMWDSLESVWKAADEDEECDAYVVPIPYFDRNPDGSFGTMHYEGEEYPEYVPVYSWEEFSLPDMKPDMVFIHNPYDEYNYVTSIHPAFYVPQLKKYAKEVIYIPYFVLGKVDMSNPEAEEKIQMFAMQPGVINSDKVIVESEEVKEAYVSILSKQFGEEHRHVWEEKILGIGSPKFDKVTNTTEEDVTIPDDWKPVLYQPDGTRKKVILYNTSVSALLKYREEMLEKMKNVFQIFYENRDEVALLWRPHPLLQTTISSMVPSLWTEYEKLVEEYRQAGWGIYDDTADLNRALALADAYYGDGSSVVKLCQEKGMPVMIQDVEQLDRLLEGEEMIPEFSIIIPAYNAEEYLTEALESVINQTYSNIEIICVNDGSDDGSSEILSEYAKKDKRIVLLNEEKNVGTSKARKDGVLVSTGRYILFLDADDTLSLNTCEVLNALPNKQDIIHFGANVNACNGMRSSSVKSMEKYLLPCTEKIEIKEMRELCFRKTILSHNLWGKCFRGDVCRKAFEYLSNARLIMAEDMYAFFVISVFARSYSGISEKLYNYNYGRGVTGEDKDFYQSFEVYCTQAESVRACYELIAKLDLDEEYADLLKCIRNNALNTCTKFLYNNAIRLEENQLEHLQSIFSHYWSSSDLAIELAKLCLKYQRILRRTDGKKWAFPFGKVKKNARIVIYGAGEMGQDYYEQVIQSDYCKIVAIVDKAYDRYTHLGYEVVSPEKLSKLEYDFIVIAIKNIEIQNEVKRYLLKMDSSNTFIEVNKMRDREDVCFTAKNEEGAYRKNSVFGLKHLSVSAMVKVEKELWVSNNRFNGLFTLDLETGKTTFQTHFIKTPKDALLIHRQAMCYNNHLFFFPNYDNKIVEYDLEKKSMLTHYLKEKNEKYWRINDIAVYGQLVYLFPVDLNQPVYSFDLESKQISESKEIVKICSDTWKKEDVKSIGLLVWEDCVWIPLNNANGILKFDLRLKAWKVFKIDIPDFAVRSVARIGDKFFMLGMDGKKIWIWHNENIEQEVVFTNQVGYQKNFACHDKLAFIGEDNSISIYNENLTLTNKVEINEGLVIKDFTFNWGMYWYSSKLVEFENYVYICPLRSAYMIEWNLTTDEIRFLDITVNYIPEECFQNVVVNSEKIDDYIEIIKLYQGNNKKRGHQNYGKNIYYDLKGENKDANG